MPSRLLQLVADVLELPVAEIGPGTGPATTGQWVSLRHLQIVAKVEEAYDVSITAREIRRIRSVGDLHDLLRARGVGE
ncbi:MAG: acyl carrier protein [Frankiaceae bacterium]